MAAEAPPLFLRSTLAQSRGEEFCLVLTLAFQRAANYDSLNQRPTDAQMPLLQPFPKFQHTVDVINEEKRVKLKNLCGLLDNSGLSMPCRPRPRRRESPAIAGPQLLFQEHLFYN